MGSICNKNVDSQTIAAPSSINNDKPEEFELGVDALQK